MTRSGFGVGTSGREIASEGHARRSGSDDPRVEDTPAAGGRATSWAARGVRILVVDDGRGVSRGVAERLAHAGCVVRVCPDAGAVLRAFVQDLPDLILAFEESTPETGLELARRVRELSDVPICLLSNEVFASIEEPARRIGVDCLGAAELAREGFVERVLALAGPVFERSPHRRLTAARVRRLARSELRAELESLLVECRGNLAEMARRMGKDRSTIRYHLRRFGMLADDVADWTGRHRIGSASDASTPP